jgi:hypothetical protein
VVHTIKTEGQALKVSRTTWAAFIAGQLLFCIFIVVAWQSAMVTPAPNAARLLFPLSAGLLLIQPPVAMFVRNQIYKKNWRGFAVTPQGYTTANTLFLASCAGVSLFGLVVVMLGGRVGLPVVVPVAAMAMQAINFPNGRAMEPLGPVLGDSRRDS